MPNKTTVGIISAGMGAIAALFLLRNKDRMKERAGAVVDGLKESTAIKLHNKLGTPVYDFLKRKNNIPF
tara:strand:+ start:32 stop:238 length:207 start_codon:yes stop_codon:yes gene_type:complete